MMLRGALLAVLIGVLFARGSLVTACTDAAGCNYNGLCSSKGVCACTTPWVGALCDVLDLLPVRDQDLALGYQGNDGEPISSWGGSVVYDPTSAQYFMYAAEMGGHCGINVWLSNSLVIVASSPDPTRVPFQRVGVVQGAFSHEPIAARAPSGEFVVYLTAVLPPEPLPVRGGKPCTGCSAGRSPASCGTDSNRNSSVPLPTYMVWAPTPTGPWSRPQLIPGTAVFADANFAPVINADGSLVALSRHSVWAARDWRNVATYVVVGQWKDEGEDPFIWRDAAGVYHGIVHCGRANTTGLHYASVDGVVWAASPGRGAAYTADVALANGTSVHFACRERPHMVLDPAGHTPIALTNGAARITCHDAGEDDHSVTFLQALRRTA